MTGIGGQLATTAAASNDYRPFTFDYDANPAERGWGQGWPTCPSSAKLAAVECDRSGTRVTVQVDLAVLVDAIMDSIERDGYLFRQVDTGAYNCRAISGTSSPSYHSWAIAIDGNWQSNPNTRYGSQKLVTDMPAWVIERWQRYGFAWGGFYLDTMHFEFMGTPAQARQQRDIALKELTDTPTIPPVPDPPAPTPRKGRTMFLYKNREGGGVRLYTSSALPLRMTTALDASEVTEIGKALATGDHVALVSPGLFARLNDASTPADNPTDSA